MRRDEPGRCARGKIWIFLAYMLGARRVGVAQARRLTGHAGLIKYHRGAATLLGRVRLNAAACGYYVKDRRAYDLAVRLGSNWRIRPASVSFAAMNLRNGMAGRGRSAPLRRADEPSARVTRMTG